MARVSEEAKRKYSEKIKVYKKKIDDQLQSEQQILQMLKSDDKGAGYKKLMLANETLNVVSYYLLMNELSLALLGIKNDAYINEGRKACFKALIYLEEVFSDYLDVPYSEYEDKLEEVSGFSDDDRFNLIRKIGFSIDAINTAFGEGSKWKWSFVDMNGRLAVVAKNCMDLKKMAAGMDPRVPGYQTRLKQLNLTRRLLQQSADDFRKKYELSTFRIDDFKRAIGFLASLKRLSIVLKRNSDVEALKKKIDIWKQKMDTDLKRMEDKQKRARLEAGPSEES
ncbi:hypothetical protein [Spirochaeta isovalerica]|uniref:Uncharacterized protein n=1 Tax=Spirochaeta isovalerica TaxID=150 RepID=A0A841REE6_9SPIO|nr:hypothetical protein [Spirochaeta isovalerica]MBB6481986.1 hypothetical protein [Spirochaeta isovalerica]